MMADTTVVTCDCGAKVRLPVDRGGRSFRCPKCKEPFPEPVSPEVVSAVMPAAGQAGALCQICQTATTAEDDCVVCPICQQIHHQDCWNEVGGCGTYGCEQAPQLEKSAATKQLTAWGDTKKCPSCGEEIKSIALKCRYCEARFETTDPMTAKDLKRQGVRTRKIENLKVTIVCLFVGSVIVCLAPIVLVAGLAILLPQMEQVKKCGPFHTTLAVISLGLSGLFSLLMLGFFVVSLFQ